MKLHRSLATVIVCLIICISVAAQNTIFYGKVIVYLRAAGKPVPQQWTDWLG